MGTNRLTQEIESKMCAAGVGRPTIDAFLCAVLRVSKGERGMAPEGAIDPVGSLPQLEDLTAAAPDATGWLEQLAVVKLNGGLGTGMGLDKAKSLIPVKGSETFLDFIARQILHLRRARGGQAPAFYLMDSFATQKDTLEYLRKYPDLAPDGPLDFLQNRVPKLDASTFEPVSWLQDPELEWCPPGHGDLYPSLLGSGLMDRLLAKGVRVLFVSNSDNLGATVDLTLLRFFVESGLSFLMEVAVRTAADRKGGHLARNRETGRLLLRESAQCPKADEAAFQDVQRHRFFNTNNLWIRLDHLKAELDRTGGTLPLPLITNTKTVDPKKTDSPKVLQLESAMGAAIECFEHTGAIVVPRRRFSPVKTTSDLLALRSDAYRVTDDFRLVLNESRSGQPPVIELDAKHYKMMAPFEKFFGASAPSLANCDRFEVVGPIQFEPGVVCEGSVRIVNTGSDTKRARAGVYRDQDVML
jgi:UDP-N-acetylglucosamine pyrophosphorylase